MGGPPLRIRVRAMLIASSDPYIGVTIPAVIATDPGELDAG
jgi:hypothetical protein